jgi:hypothetical protein
VGAPLTVALLLVVRVVLAAGATASPTRLLRLPTKPQAPPTRAAVAVAAVRGLLEVAAS